jgi:phosphoribosylamine--glycine ligase
MKYLMYSEFSEGAGVLLKIQQEEEDAGLFIKDRVYRDCYDGIVSKEETPNINSDTLVIFDMSGNGKKGDEFRSLGAKVFGSSPIADKLEHDRDFGFEVMESCGILVPTTKKFKTFKEGINYTKNFDGKLVFKPNGSMPCKLTYCSSDNEELVAYLNFVDKQFGSEIDDFILQEFLEGVVVSSEAFCDGKKFLRPFNHTVEVKKFMDGDKGPSTGCSGNITWACWGCNICENGVALAEKFCVKHDYVGQIDLNAVVNEDGIHGLEWTPRFGYDATPIFLTLLDIPYSKFFSDVCSGQIKEIPVKEEYAGSVRFSIPPYPAELQDGQDSEKFSPNVGIPIQNWHESFDSIYFYEVKIDGNELVHSHGTGVIGLVWDHNDSPEKTLDKPYGILDKLHIPDLQFRTDLQSVLGKMVTEVNDYA